MNYFKVLGIVFGLAAFLKPFYMHLLPWDENKFIAKVYSSERPAWIIPVAVFGLLLVALTWYMHFVTDIQYSLVLTILFSLTAIKAIVFIFDYKRFHEWVVGMLKKDKGRGIVMVDVAASIFGLAVILLALFVY